MGARPPAGGEPRPPGKKSSHRPFPWSIREDMDDTKIIEESPEGIKVVVNEEVEHQREIIDAAARKHGIDEDQIALFRQFTAASAEWHDDTAKKLMRKVDLHLLPMLILMYMLNFLDRK